jgi:hypothetical protein
MSEILSFFSVIALWMGLGILAWLVHQRRSGSRQHRQTSLARQAADHVAEAQAVFDHVRQGQPGDGERGPLVQQTHALLKRIQERGAFFDGVNALRQQIQQALRGEECEPLAEILHIRRDLWAASEIILIEDFRSLGPAFDDENAYERLRQEAAHVLFLDGARRPGQQDLIDLRLALAREEAAQFFADVEEAIRLAREDERLPTFSEIVAYPIAAARALPGHIRTLRAQMAAFSAQVRAVTLTIRQSETMTRGLSELRRAREELPRRVVTGLEKTSTAARQSAVSLKGHYDFLVAAYDVQAKYEELLRKAPVATERGKQFIARLELAEKSERLKLTVSDAAKRFAVRALAHLIAGLQRLQGALERRLAAAQSSVDPELGAAARPSPKPAASIPATPPKALKAPASPAAQAKQIAPIAAREGSRLQARPSTPARTSVTPAQSEVLAAPTPIPPAIATTAKQASVPATAKAAAELPKLSLSNGKAPETGKDKTASIAQKPGDDSQPRQRQSWLGSRRDPKARGTTQKTAPGASAMADTKSSPAVAPASADKPAPQGSRGWLSSRQQGKQPSLPSKPAPGAPSANPSSPGGKSPIAVPAATDAQAPVTASLAAASTEKTAPKTRRGWFSSRRSEKERSPAGKSTPTDALAKAGARGDGPPARTPAVADAKAPAAAAPAAVSDDKAAPKKRREWFASRRPKLAPSATLAKAGSPGDGPSSIPPVDAKAPVTGLLAAVSTEKTASKKRRGWFSSQRSEKEPSLAGKTAPSAAPAKAGSLGDEPSSIPPADATAPVTESLAAVSAEKTAPKTRRGWFSSRRSEKEPSLAGKTAPSAASAKANSRGDGPPPFALGVADAKAPVPASLAAVSAEKTAPEKRGRWFSSRRPEKEPDPSAKAALGTAAPQASSGEISPPVPLAAKGAKATPAAIPATPAAAADERAMPKKSGGWFRSRRSKAAEPVNQAASRAPVENTASHGEQIPPSALAAEDAGGDEAETMPAQDIAHETALSAVPASPLPPAKQGAPAKASLSAKLTDATAIDPGDEEIDNQEEAEIAAQETEDDDPGPLTRGILESRAAQREEKPAKSHSSAFPWLRR